MQRIEGRGLLCHCPKELKIQDAPNESTDAAGGEKDHDKSRFFFGAQYSTYATKKKPFRPLPDPKTFLSSPAKHYPQGLDFQNRRPSSRTGPEADSLHPLARSDRNRRIFLGLVVGVQERRVHQ